MDPLAIIELLNKGLDVAQPFINESFQQKTNHEHQERIRDWQALSGHLDDPKSADAIQSFVLQLLTEAGQTVGSVDSRFIRVPLDCFDALVVLASEKIKQDRLLGAIEYKRK
jgi:hypothetical protein